MHISEGIITGVPALAYTGVSLGLVGVGAKKMKGFVKENPEKKTMLGMAGAFIFFLSLVPIPAFTGTTTHPCGSPLIGILLGPWIGIALTGLSLLLQAAFFAHGGFSTWGANVITLGIGGAFFGWLAFRVARRSGLSLITSAAIGGLIGDVMTYVFAGLSLGAVLSTGPTPRFSFLGYLFAIYAAYLPTQLPIALGEMFLTGYIIHFIYKQRSDILISLKVIPAYAATVIMLFVMLLFLAVPARAADGMAGMDETVNEEMAIQAGKEPREPYIDIESTGELWTAVLMLSGGLCGFIIGRGWEKFFGKRKINE
ncbi:MAG: energy-coupling factor ABC transporter permease [bacterium]|nr:energy-coupling factor ABC transporter permease [bacterium]